jgi:hypothetical protein
MGQRTDENNITSYNKDIISFSVRTNTLLITHEAISFTSSELNHTLQSIGKRKKGRE